MFILALFLFAAVSCASEIEKQEVRQSEAPTETSPPTPIAINEAPTGVATNLLAFEATDIQGVRVASKDFRRKPIVLLFFDTESVLAWRTLAQMENAVQNGWENAPSMVGFGRRRVKDGMQPDPDHVRTFQAQFSVRSPIVLDTSGKYFETFNVPSCCDSAVFYSPDGKLSDVVTITELQTKLNQRATSLVAPKAVTTPEKSPDVIGDAIGHLSVDTPSGKQPLPVGKSGVTVVALFNDFCSECETGQRLDFLRELNASGTNPNIVIVFSGKSYSKQDVENFKSMLDLPFPLYSADLSTLDEYLVEHRLLLVLDSRRHIVWYEKPGMSDQDVAKAVRESSGIK